jgi:hypothetical protein
MLGGAGILAKFNRSLPTALQNAYSDHEWDMWKFSRLPRNYYASDEHRKDVLARIASELKITSLEHWYGVSAVQIKKLGARQLLKYGEDGQGLYAVLRQSYPDHTWYPWLFASTANGYWSDQRMHRLYLNWLAGRLGLEADLSCWYSVTSHDVRQNYGSSLLTNHYAGSVSKLVTANFQEHSWDEQQFASHRKPRKQQSAS